MPLDIVRDKDGNASSLAIAEAFAYLESLSTHPLEFLDTLYKKYGYHFEKTENIYFEGAEGNRIIEGLVESYRKKPLETVSEIKVTKLKDFSQDGYIDADNETLPTQNFIQLTLENGYTIAIRPSGTEPKIKYYLFGCGEPNASNLESSKEEVHQQVDSISQWLVEDAHKRANQK